MPLSTSNSNHYDRVIPNRPWGKHALIGFILFLLMIVAYETWCRSKGYGPSIDDNKDLWSYNRQKVERNLKGTVLIGASRMLFDFNLEVYKDIFGHEPIQLATVGTNATFYLDDIANNSEFSGTVFMDILPMLLFVPEGAPVATPMGNIKYYKDWSLSQKASFYLGLIPDQLFSFLEPTDLALNHILERLPIENRADAKLPPTLPPYFMEIHNLNRQGLMIAKTEVDKTFAEMIQNRWIPLFTPPPAPPIFTPDQFREIFMKHVSDTISKMKANVQKIQDRGGKVIFVRYPSTHVVRELENKFTPNVAFWDRIVAETKPNLAVSFEDYPELQGFQCPEWSHLNRTDAVEFTKRLLGIVKRTQ